MPTWSQPLSLRGATGAQLRSGTGTPSSTNPSTQSDGDYFLSTDTLVLYGPRASGAWPPSGYALKGATGPAGSSITSGSAAPGASYGSDNDLYVQLPATLYKKASGVWSVVGVLANTITYGTAAPGQNFGGGGDVYLQNSGGTTSLWSKASGVWSQVATLTGSQGPAGSRGAAILPVTGAPTTTSPSGQQDGDYALDTATPGGPFLYGPRASGAWPSTPVVLGGSAFRSGSGSPASAIGSVGDFYIDTAASVLWGPKTASGWPAAGVPLVGPAGGAGPAGAAGVSPPGMYSGAGAPTATNPSGTQIVGSYYIRTDTSPNQLYGPLTASGWPATGVAMVGNAFEYGSGPPASSLGGTGDTYFDLQNALAYPNKTASGWTNAPINLIGPTGPAGATTMPAATWCPGPPAYANAVALSSTPQTVNALGTSVPQVFAPLYPSALLGVGVTCNTSAATVSLYDQTAGAAVYTASVAANTNNWLGPFSSTTYPLTANHQYVWQVSGTGTSTVQIYPDFLVPSAAAVPAVCPSSNWATPTASALSATATATYAAGIRLTSARSFYFVRSGSLYSISATYTPSVVGAAAANAQLQIASYVPNGATTTVYTTGNIPNTGALTTFGPFTPGTYAWSAGYLLFVNVVGTGTGQVNADLNLIV